jgi:hypothetical protein
MGLGMYTSNNDEDVDDGDDDHDDEFVSVVS